jgi:hypothetical protein
MASIGKNQFLVRLLHAKTKIKIDDIAEVLNLLPECLAEAFFEANPGEKQALNFGAFTINWRNTNLGPGFVFKPSKSFIKHTSRIRIEQKHDLAVLLLEKMLPIVKERVLGRLEKEKENISAQIPKKYHSKEVYAARSRKNRIKAKENRKKQAIILNAIK